MAQEILQTKLNRPVTGRTFVRRPRLHETMNQALDVPLTLVSAPAGYGKTALLSQWLESVNLPSAWVSLDEDDSSLDVFLRYILAAVRELCPKGCLETKRLVKAHVLPPPTTVAGLLISDLEAVGKPFILVFDDYHRIRGTDVPEMLGHMLKHPSRSLRLVLLTRRDPPLPLAGLRARGQVAEVRLEDLRFDTQEMSAFLEQIAGVFVSDQVLSGLEAQLEGWAVGLQLAGLALRNRESSTGFLSDLTGGTLDMRRYLVGEVLAAQSEVMQDWLLKSSILDRFCPSLCDAVCGAGSASGDSVLSGEDFVRFLEEGELFCTSLDSGHEWHRYHSLFQAFLNRELNERIGKERISALHRNACSWFAEKGLIDEAVHHALAAGDIFVAANIVEENRDTTLNEDGVQILARWLAKLPDEIKNERPLLLLTDAWIALYQFRLASVPPVLEKTEKMLSEEESRQALGGEVDALHGYFWYLRGDGSRAEEHLDRALEKLGNTSDFIGCETNLHYCLALHMNGHKELAINKLRESLAGRTSQRALSDTRLWAGLCFIHLLCGDLAEAQRVGEQLTHSARSRELVYAETWGLYLQGCACFQLNTLEEAEPLFRAVVKGRYATQSRVAVDALCALTLVYHLLQEPDRVKQTLDVLDGFVSETNDPTCAAIAASLQARLALMQGDPEAASRLARGFDLEEDEGIMLWWVEIPHITECRIQIADGSRGSTKEALRKLRKYEKDNRAVHNDFQLVEILLLQFQAYRKQEKRSHAAAVLKRAVALAAPGKVLQPFLDLNLEIDQALRKCADTGLERDLIQRVRDARWERRSKLPEDTADPVKAHPQSRNGAQKGVALTKREIETLGLLERGLLTREIADTMFVSYETVKSHVKSICRKLDAGNRKEAVARARDIGILPHR
jgi:LuxR family maltose regulon positive regulatory protein